MEGHGQDRVQIDLDVETLTPEPELIKIRLDTDHCDARQECGQNACSVRVRKLLKAVEHFNLIEAGQKQVFWAHDFVL